MRPLYDCALFQGLPEAELHAALRFFAAQERACPRGALLKAAPAPLHAFGLVLDGSERVDGIIRSAMSWDVMGGVARRSWARNAHGMETAMDYNARRANEGHITIPYIVNDGIIEKAVADKMNK